MINSMTGFAAGKGACDAFSWTWDIRSVNGKGLDIRLRAPDWITGLETHLRKRVADDLGRGNVSIGLRLQRQEQSGVQSLNKAQLEAVLSAMNEVEDAAMDIGLSLAPSTAGEILKVSGILEIAVREDDPAPLLKALQDDFEPVLEAFKAARAAEGKALHRVIASQLDEIEVLLKDTSVAIEERRATSEESFRAALARILGEVEFDEDRMAQELALLAVKTDVTEEIDRLTAHIAAARSLLEEGGPIGRKFDFLAQEFNREANTLCSKSQNAKLTEVGLSLKATIDQMREQIQNVE